MEWANQRPQWRGTGAAMALNSVIASPNQGELDRARSSAPPKRIKDPALHCHGSEMGKNIIGQIIIKQ